MDEDLIHDLFASEGPVQIRRLFGGQGVYIDGLIVAIAFKDELLLKCDGETAALFEAAGCRRWSYQRPGKSPVAMPYFFLPPEAYEDPDAMAQWARHAREAARRMGARPSRRPARRSPRLQS